MKRIIKNSNKKGFTLVETLLATFILVVISTMLVNGFIATMGYSYQTSVYSKSGANNYAACMDKLYTWSEKKDRGTNGRQKALEGKNFTKDLKPLTFESSGASCMKTLYVGLDVQNELKNTVPQTLPFQTAAYAPKDGTADHGGVGTDALADNRKVIYYYPEYYRGEEEDSKYKIGIRIDEEHLTNSKPTYEWVVLPGYEVGENDDLSGLKGKKVIGVVGGDHQEFGKKTSDSSTSEGA